MTDALRRDIHSGLLFLVFINVLVLDSLFWIIIQHIVTCGELTHFPIGLLTSHLTLLLSQPGTYREATSRRIDMNNESVIY